MHSPAIYNLLFLLSTRVKYTTNHQALAVICGESCSCSSCLSTSEIVGPRSRELANLGTRPRGRGRGWRYREAEARQRPRTKTVLWQEPYPTDRVIIMIYDTQYVMGRANAICDANTLWAARMRYANTLRAARIRYGPRKRDMRYAICDMWIRYGPRECYMRSANTQRAICEYAIGRANTICDTRIGIGYARCEQLQSGFLGHNNLCNSPSLIPQIANIKSHYVITQEVVGTANISMMWGIYQICNFIYWNKCKKA